MKEGERIGVRETGLVSGVDDGERGVGGIAGGGGKPFPCRFPSLTDAFAKALRTFLARSTSSRSLSLL